MVKTGLPEVNNGKVQNLERKTTFLLLLVSFIGQIFLCHLLIGHWWGFAFSAHT